MRSSEVMAKRRRCPPSASSPLIILIFLCLSRCVSYATPVEEDTSKSDSDEGESISGRTSFHSAERTTQHRCEFISKYEAVAAESQDSFIETLTQASLSFHSSGELSSQIVLTNLLNPNEPRPGILVQRRNHQFLSAMFRGSVQQSRKWKQGKVEYPENFCEVFLRVVENTINDLDMMQNIAKAAAQLQVGKPGSLEATRLQRSHFYDYAKWVNNKETSGDGHDTAAARYLEEMERRFKRLSDARASNWREKLTSFSIQGEDRSEPSCSICLQEYRSGDTITDLPCLHRFHSTCIRNWQDVRKVCPQCTRSLDVPDQGYQSIFTDPQVAGEWDVFVAQILFNAGCFLMQIGPNLELAQVLAHGVNLPAASTGENLSAGLLSLRLSLSVRILATSSPRELRALIDLRKPPTSTLNRVEDFLDRADYLNLKKYQSSRQMFMHGVLWTLVCAAYPVVTGETMNRIPLFMSRTAISMYLFAGLIFIFENIYIQLASLRQQ